MSKLKIIKLFSLIASILGMIGTAFVTTRENEETLQRLVNQKLGE